MVQKGLAKREREHEITLKTKEKKKKKRWKNRGQWGLKGIRGGGKGKGTARELNRWKGNKAWS